MKDFDEWPRKSQSRTKEWKNGEDGENSSKAKMLVLK